MSLLHDASFFKRIFSLKIEDCKPCIVSNNALRYVSIGFFKDGAIVVIRSCTEKLPFSPKGSY